MMEKTRKGNIWKQTSGGAINFSDPQQSTSLFAMPISYNSHLGTSDHDYAYFGDNLALYF